MKGEERIKQRSCIEYKGWIIDEERDENSVELISDKWEIFKVFQTAWIAKNYVDGFEKALELTINKK